MWKAVVVAVSEVDSGGTFEVTFNITIDGVAKYPGLLVRGSSRVELRDKMLVIAAGYKQVEVEKNKIKVGDEVLIP